MSSNLILESLSIYSKGSVSPNTNPTKPYAVSYRASLKAKIFRAPYHQLKRWNSLHAHASARQSRTLLSTLWERWPWIGPVLWCTTSCSISRVSDHHLASQIIISHLRSRSRISDHHLASPITIASWRTRAPRRLRDPPTLPEAHCGAREDHARSGMGANGRDDGADGAGGSRKSKGGK